MRRRLVAVFAGVMLVLGTWQLAGAAYIHAKAWLAQELLEDAWQLTLAGQQRVKPWSWADTWPVARLKVPRLGEQVIVLAGAHGQSLAFGPGHVAASSLPGTPGTSIISAHRDTHFAFLANIQTGDEVVITTQDQNQHRYRVTSMWVVDAWHFAIRQDDNQQRVLLTTCYPFNAISTGGQLRYVVEAEAVDSTLSSKGYIL